MKSRVILNHRDRRDKNNNNNNNNYTQIDTMERKPLEVEPSTTTTTYSAVDGGGSDGLTSKVDDEQRKIVYRGWKVMPFIIGNAFFFLPIQTAFFFSGALSDFRKWEIKQTI